MPELRAVFEVEAATAAVLAGWADGASVICSYDEPSRILILSFQSAERREQVVRAIWAVEHLRPVNQNSN
jgi:hypothetical protein